MKRILAVFTIIVLCFTLAAGCAKQSDSAEDARVSGVESGAAEDASPSVAELSPYDGSGAAGERNTPDIVPSPEGTVQGTPADTQGPDASENAAPPDAVSPPEPSASETIETPKETSSSGAAVSESAGPSAAETIVESPPGSPEPPEESQAPGTSEPSAAPASPDEPVILTIFGAGVAKETTWTLSQLQSISKGYCEYVYSTTNNWPRFGHATAHGVSLQYLLLYHAGMTNNSMGFIITATDGYRVTVTLEQVFSGMMYSYSNHSAAGSSGASRVEPIIAWEWGEGSVRPENIRTFFGQCGPYDVNTSVFVQNVCKIEVLTESPGVWDAPEASIAGGSVSAGTALEFLHSSMDSVKIYYTLDGSDPNYNSAVYNPSTSYFQPELTVPIILQESVTVKAFAAGYGKDRSAVVVFEFVIVT